MDRYIGPRIELTAPNAAGPTEDPQHHGPASPSATQREIKAVSIANQTGRSGR